MRQTLWFCFAWICNDLLILNIRTNLLSSSLLSNNLPSKCRCWNILFWSRRFFCVRMTYLLVFFAWEYHLFLRIVSHSHPDYCTRYYRCAHGVDQGFECPKGTAWDEETKSCAWVEHVNCEQKKLDYSTTSPTSEGMKRGRTLSIDK